MKTALLPVLVLLPFLSKAQAELFASQAELLHTRADTINITHYLLNEPADKDFSTKFKVLEFWATWCKPCLKAVPHINKLQARFKDSNIVFLSFTYETPAKTAATFEKVRFETIVVSDTTRRIHQRLRVDYNGTMGLPRTVLIDDRNRIVWYGNPAKLNAGIIEKFLRRENLGE